MGDTWFLYFGPGIVLWRGDNFIGLGIYILAQIVGYGEVITSSLTLIGLGIKAGDSSYGL